MPKRLTHRNTFPNLLKNGESIFQLEFVEWARNSEKNQKGFATWWTGIFYLPLFCPRLIAVILRKRSGSIRVMERA